MRQDVGRLEEQLEGGEDVGKRAAPYPGEVGPVQLRERNIAAPDLAAPHQGIERQPLAAAPAVRQPVHLAMRLELKVGTALREWVRDIGVDPTDIGLAHAVDHDDADRPWAPVAL
jgi:hypothetical protein